MFDVKTMNLEEELKRASNLPGQERAQNLKFLIKYTEKNYGQSGVDKVMSLLKKHNIKLPDISIQDNMDWVPSDYTAQYMLAMAKAFDWQNSDVDYLGRNLRAYSHLMKFVIKYFLNFCKSLKQAEVSWPTHYNWGQMELVECDTKQRRAVYRIRNFKKHPITCIYLCGVFAGLSELGVEGRVQAKEKKCQFEGDEVHELEIVWGKNN